MKANETRHNDPPFPEWLKEQQHHSWQIEILISGGFIFFLAQLPDFFKEFLLQAAQGMELGPGIVILVAGGYMFSRALLIGFAINLIFRTLWLGFLGINFAFPKGIDYERLGYSEYFNEKIKKTPSVVTRIIDFEKICSLSYSIAILITLMSIGLFLLLSALMVLLSKVTISIDSPLFGYSCMVLIALMILGFLDFLFFGFLKKSESVSRFYFPFYKLFGWLSLSFLYRKEWFTLISNLNRWKVYLIFLVYFSVAFLISTTEMSRYISGGIPSFDLTEERRFADFRNSYQILSRSRYENMLQPNDKIFNACLESEILGDGYSSIFVAYKKRFDPALAVLFEENGVEMRHDSIRKLSWNGFLKNDTLLASTLSIFFEIHIDEQIIESTDWFIQNHPKTKERGFRGYFRLDSIESGRHRLDIYHKVLKNDTLANNRFNSFQFFKE